MNEITPYSIGRRFLGIKERRGKDHHPQILAWLELAGGPSDADEVAWCGAFVNGIAWILGIARPASPARARSWLTVGSAVLPTGAKVGFDLVILSRGEGAQPGPEVLQAPGHVGFFAGWDAVSPSPTSRVKVLGGNQGDAVSVADFPLDRVLAVRRLRMP
jgi:uncharacterized protein (TIGR02594 family)